MSCKAHVKYTKTNNSHQHATFQITIAVEQIKRKMKKYHGTLIGKEIADVMLLPMVRLSLDKMDVIYSRIVYELKH